MVDVGELPVIGTYAGVGCGDVEEGGSLQMNSGPGDRLALRSASKSLERTWRKSTMPSVMASLTFFPG